MTTRKKRTVKTIPNGPLEQTIAHHSLSIQSAHERIDLLVEKIHASENTPSTDKSKEVAALVGIWIDRQKASGQTTVDLKRVDDVRTGIELALS